MTISIRKLYKSFDIFREQVSFQQHLISEVTFVELKISRIMQPIFKNAVTIFCVVMILICAIISTTEGTYRKPPFNGSIFGKRSGSNNEYDSASKALSAMCEIASEACQTWFPITQEK